MALNRCGWMVLVLGLELASAMAVEQPRVVPGAADESRVEASGAGAAAGAPAAEGLLPPVPLAMHVDVAPAELQWESDASVTVVIRVDESGAVSFVRLLSSSGVVALDHAVLTGATQFRFEPARYRGEPVEVEITYTHRFEAKPPLVEEDGKGLGADNSRGPALDAALVGRIVERGTQKPVSDAMVTAVIGGVEHHARTGADGVFELKLPAGRGQVRVIGAGYQVFFQDETLTTGEQIKVKYLVDRASYDPYETVIRSTKKRLEVARTTLRGREIKRIPGTFGDPFRVVTVLPGVTSMMSLLPLPVVRGSSPGSTGFLLDGERLPMLFHFLGGPAVVHPEFIERVDFFAGGFRVPYGGYAAGIVDGVTRPARSDESHYEVDLSASQTGVFAREGLSEWNSGLTLAGRYGYPGLLMKLANSEGGLSYWDYQSRFDHGSRRDGFTLFALGARDHVTERIEGQDSTALLFEFHRVDAELRRRIGRVQTSYRLVLGTESTGFGEDSFSTRSRTVAPRVRLALPLGASVRLNSGIDLNARMARVTLPAISTAGDNDLTTVNSNNAVERNTSDSTPGRYSLDTGTLYTGSVFSELEWEPTDRLVLIPGVRADVYSHEGATQSSFDPRLSARYRLAGAAAAEGGTWLKGSVGIYHQPPRLFLPIPGLAESLLDRGLLASYHSVVGVEYSLGSSVELDVQGYFNYMNPVFFEPPGASNDNVAIATPGPSSAPGQPPGDNPVGFDSRANSGNDDEPFENLLMRKGVGRAYGLEILLRHRQSSRFFGWLAYTLSRSERRRDGQWVVFDYDRAHIVNAVAGLRLPRNWEFGVRVLYQTGTPVNTIYGVNSSRVDPQFRVDIRFDKRAVWNDWLLDFYVDIINGTVSPESGGIVGARGFRYVIPSVGFRGVL